MAKWFNRRPKLFLSTYKRGKGYFLLRLFNRFMVYYKDVDRWDLTSKEIKARSSRVFFGQHYLQVKIVKKKAVSLQHKN